MRSECVLLSYLGHRIVSGGWWTFGLGSQRPLSIKPSGTSASQVSRGEKILFLKWDEWREKRE